MSKRKKQKYLAKSMDLYLFIYLMGLLDKEQGKLELKKALRLTWDFS